MVFRAIGLCLATLLSALGPAMAGDLDALTGAWRTVRHNADVEISDCGDGTPCGFLRSVSTEMTDGETTDVRNKDPELRGRPLEGLPILWGFSHDTDGWYRGRLYNPNTGQTFRSSMTLLSPRELKVKGCLGPLCRQQIWIRLDEANSENKES